MADIIQALGGLSGLATLLTAIGGIFAFGNLKGDTKELKNNHGSSLRDAVDEITNLVMRMESTQAVVSTKVDSLSDRVDANSGTLAQISKDLTDERHERQRLDERALHEHQRMWDTINCIDRGKNTQE